MEAETPLQPLAPWWLPIELTVCILAWLGRLSHDPRETFMTSMSFVEESVAADAAVALAPMRLVCRQWARAACDAWVVRWWHIVRDEAWLTGVSGPLPRRPHRPLPLPAPWDQGLWVAVKGRHVEALRDAAERGDVQRVHALLCDGCDVTAPSDVAPDAACMAARGGHCRVLLLLLRAGVARASRTGIAALEAGDADALSLLLDHGHVADARALCRLLRSDADAAVVRACLDVLRGRLAVDVFGDEGVQMLCAAATATPDIAADAVRLVLAVDGADVNVAGEDGLTALHRCVMSVRRSGVAVLLEAGADADAASDDGSTPLHLACLRMHPDLPIVRRLLRGGADANAVDTDGHVPGYAHDAGSVVRVLLQQHRDDNSMQ